MRFFTDKTVKNEFLLIKIKDYFRLQKNGNKFSQWKEVFVDPGVYDLKNDYKFLWEGKINIKNFLNSLPKNHYFSCDLPSDMNLKYKKYFLEKSWQYAQAYSYHSQFIVTVQFYHKDHESFIENFDKYNSLKIKSGILGIGNYCKHFYYNEFVNHTLHYIFKNSKHPKIHIYGLALRLIPIASNLARKYNIKLSIDSTKWTRAVTNEFKKNNGVSCRGHNRQLYFNTYLDEIQKRYVSLENELYKKF